MAACNDKAGHYCNMGRGFCIAPLVPVRKTKRKLLVFWSLLQKCFERFVFVTVPRFVVGVIGNSKGKPLPFAVVPYCKTRPSGI